MDKPREEDERPIQLAAKAVGLQVIKEYDPSVEEMDLNPNTKVWVLNGTTHITERGTPIYPANSPFVWLGRLRKAKKGSDCIVCEELASTVTPRDLTPKALVQVIEALRESYLNNFHLPFSCWCPHTLFAL